MSRTNPAGAYGPASPGSRRDCVGIVVSIIGTLFSSKGLAALGSFLIINLWVGFIFYRRYRKVLLRNTEKDMGRFKKSLVRVWMDSIDAILEDLAKFREQLLTRSEELSRLQKDREANIN